MRVHLNISLRRVPRIRAFAGLLGAAAPHTPYVSCPECGTGQIKRLAETDGIDRMSTVPWSTLQRYLGGRLYYCAFCRLQFHDCRRRLHAPAPVEKPRLQIVHRPSRVLIPID